MLPSLLPELKARSEAILALADGTIFRGESIGASGHCVANLALSTVMCGYQETLFAPAHQGKILTLTYPHAGNIGIDSTTVPDGGQVAGLVVRDCPDVYAHYQASLSLPDFLLARGIVAISGVDTRKLARILRKGPQQACILVGDDPVQALALLGVQPADNTAAIASNTLSSLASGSHVQGGVSSGK